MPSATITNRSSTMSTVVKLFLLLCLSALLRVHAEESINAYIPSKHKVLFDDFNAIIFGDASLAKAAFRGSLAVEGKANIADFDIGFDQPCDLDKRALLSAGPLNLRSGTLHNGYLVMGRNSQVHHTVKTPCTNRVERFSTTRNNDLDFVYARQGVVSETAQLCAAQANSNFTITNSTMSFHPGTPGFNCYSTFKVSANDLRLIDTWKYEGDDFYRNLIITVSGRKNEFREFRMLGFNPRRTLVVFCAMYGMVSIADAKFHSSILAPSNTFTMSNAIINGSIIVGGLRGSVATLNIPYVTC